METILLTPTELKLAYSAALTDVLTAFIMLVILIIADVIFIGIGRLSRNVEVSKCTPMFRNLIKGLLIAANVVVVLTVFIVVVQFIMSFGGII